MKPLIAIAALLLSGCSAAFWQGFARGVNNSSQSEPPQQRYEAPVAHSGPTCQLDDMALMFTGETRSEWGKLLKRYTCPAGHAYWIAD